MTNTINSINTLLDTLNDNQKKVVYSTSRRLLCLAGAGTGKTHTLICKILYNTEILKLEPNNILALTFTNNAGHEMKQRYCKYSNSLNFPFFGTFHSFCYSLIATDIDVLKYLGYHYVPEIISEISEKVYIEKALMLSGVKLNKKDLKFQNESKLTADKKFQFKVFHKTLTKLLIKDNKITFDKLCYDICNLFIIKHPLILKYLDKYSYILVDEFQDTDNIQWNFIQAFSNKSSIILVGDVNQSLYSFRGADCTIIKSLIDDNSWDVIRLDLNYRSTYEICNWANDFISRYKPKDENIQLLSQFKGDKVRIITNNQFYAEILKQKLNTAVLCRTNKEVEYIVDYLNNNNCKFHKNSTVKISELVKCALDNTYKHDYYLSMCSESERCGLIRKELFLSEFDSTKYLEDKFKDIENKLEKILEYDNFSEIERLYSLGEITLSDIKSDIEWSNSLYVGTIHSVKGLEFDEVYVFGVNSSNFNISLNEDMMNLYYVACTRAKYRLIIVQN